MDNEALEMIQTAVVTDYYDWIAFNEDLNKLLFDIRKNGGYVKDVKFTTNAKSGGAYYSALIIFKTMKKYFKEG